MNIIEDFRLSIKNLETKVNQIVEDINFIKTAVLKINDKKSSDVKNKCTYEEWIEAHEKQVVPYLEYVDIEFVGISEIRCDYYIYVIIN